MTQIILIGKNRRITLDELYNLSSNNGIDAKLELQGDEATTSSANDSTYDTSDANEEKVLSSILEKLSLNGGSSSSSSSGEKGSSVTGMLSPSATIASLTLLALTIAQRRVIRGDCAMKVVASLVSIINSIVSSETTATTRKKIVLSENGAQFVKGLNGLLEEELQNVVEDKSYVVRCIDVARVALTLTQGTYSGCYFLSKCMSS